MGRLPIALGNLTGYSLELPVFVANTTDERNKIMILCPWLIKGPVYTLSVPKNDANFRGNAGFCLLFIHIGTVVP